VKRKNNLLILPLIILLSTCELFLGPEPNTSPPEILKSLWNDFNNIHANLDFRMSNNNNYNSWYDVYHNKQNGYALKVSSNTTEEKLFEVCANMLGELNDPHVALYVPGKHESSYVGIGNQNFYTYIVRNYLTGRGNSVYKNFIYGTFTSNPNIGYIYIESFINKDKEIEGEEWGRAIDKIINSFANTKALVLDVRGNSGGEVYAMEYIAARFASEQKDYIKARTKNGPGLNDLSSPKTYTIKSVKFYDSKSGYTKPIVLLTNKNTVSAAEWFTLALRTQDHVTHIGTATCGAFSGRIERFMINGWLYSISAERVTDINGKTYEGIGIPPDIIKENTTYSKDEQLEEALKLAVNAE
jgi:C-terminal processing protease CtpA/Prc